MDEIKQCVGKRSYLLSLNDIVFKCTDKNDIDIIMISKSEAKKMNIDHSEYVFYYKKVRDEKTGEVRNVIVDFKPVHSFVPRLKDIVYNVSQNYIELSATLYGKCTECGLEKDVEKVDLKIPIDIIEVNGKLYIPLGGLIEVKDTTNVRPLVRFARLLSGAYVPIDALDSKTLGEVIDLEERHKSLKERHDKECAGDCDYKKFSEIYNSINDIIAKQVKNVIERLKRSGFEFKIAKQYHWYIVEVRAPDRSKSYFYFNKSTLTEEFNGKWSPLGKTFFIYTRFKRVRFSEINEDNKSYKNCLGRLHFDQDKAFFVCLDPSRKVAIPIGEVDPKMEDHYYNIAYVKVASLDNYEIGIGVSYVPFHENKVDMKTREVIIGSEKIEYGQGTISCYMCGTKIGEKIVQGRERISIVSVNGTLKYVTSDKDYYVFVDLLQEKEARGLTLHDFDVEVNYIQLPSGLLVPLDDVGIDTIRALLEIEIMTNDNSLEEQAKVLFTELKEKGYDMRVEKVRDKTICTITSPSGKKGVFKHVRGILDNTYRGGYSLLGELCLNVYSSIPQIVSKT